MIINLYGGPGAGKSTVAAGLFNLMNKTFQGLPSAELVTEYAKDLNWENRHTTLQNQFYVDAKQYRNLFRVVDSGVDIIITDSPVMKGSYYAKRYCPHFPDAYHETLKFFDDTLGLSMNIFLKRAGDYQQLGRNEPEEAAREMDDGLEQMLTDVYGTYHTVTVSPTVEQDILTLYTNETIQRVVQL